MRPVTGAEFLGTLRDLRLLDQGRIEHLGRAEALPPAASLAESLATNGWLTVYQARKVLAGTGRGLLLGPYVLLDELGEGGIGEVFRARHRQTGRVEAIKRLKADYHDDHDAVTRFQREARAAARLAHPNLVRLYSVGEADGRLYLAMEYVPGLDLGRLVDRDGPLAADRVCTVLHQAALGLAHAHAAGLVHRDVKPSNLLLTADGPTVKLLDLGLARVVAVDSEVATSAMTPSDLVMGTPDYMSPEQAMHSRQVDARSDLYSLGCTAYHLLVGHPPFLGGGMMEKLLRHQVEPPPPLRRGCPDVPAGLERVVVRLMQKDPAKRYQSAAELAAALRPLLTPVGDWGEVLPAGAPPGAATIITPRPGERPWPAWLIAVAAVGGGVALALAVRWLVS
jgi:serine/threonine protein kinase